MCHNSHSQKTFCFFVFHVLYFFLSFLCSFSWCFYLLILVSSCSLCLLGPPHCALCFGWVLFTLLFLLLQFIGTPHHAFCVGQTFFTIFSLLLQLMNIFHCVLCVGHVFFSMLFLLLQLGILFLVLFVLVGHFLLCSLWFCRCHLTSWCCYLACINKLCTSKVFFHFFPLCVCVFVVCLIFRCCAMFCLFVVICFCRVTLQILNL